MADNNLSDGAVKAYAVAAAEKVEDNGQATVQEGPSHGELLASVAGVAIEPAVVAEPVIVAPATSADPELRKAARKAPRAKVEKVVAGEPAIERVEKIEVVKPARKSVAPATEVIAASTPSADSKDLSMSEKTKKTAEEFAARAKDAVEKAQARAKAAYGKNKERLSDAGEFTKGNLEAIREAGKILASGVKVLGKTYVEGTKSNVAIVRADVKELRAVAKSPKEFVKLQGSMMKKYFETARASNSKQTEAVRKLGKEALRPISSRVSLAVNKNKKAA